MVTRTRNARFLNTVDRELVRLTYVHVSLLVGSCGLWPLANARSCGYSCSFPSYTIDKFSRCLSTNIVPSGQSWKENRKKNIL